MLIKENRIINEELAKILKAKIDKKLQKKQKKIKK